MTYVYWPTGDLGVKPSDGFSYWVGNKKYMWDDFKYQWEVVQDLGSEEKKKTECECGADSTNQPGHSHWCKLFKKV